MMGKLRKIMKDLFGEKITVVYGRAMRVQYYANVSGTMIGEGSSVWLIVVEEEYGFVVGVEVVAGIGVGAERGI